MNNFNSNFRTLSLHRYSAKLSTLVQATLVGMITLAMFMTSACSSCSTKPSQESCQQAIANIRKIHGTTTMNVGATPRQAIRSCQGTATRQSVQCFIDANSEEDLLKCTGKSGQDYLEKERKVHEEFERKANQEKENEAKEANEN